MSTPRVAIQLVTHNGSHYLPFLFNSLANQSYRDFTVLICDNASTDDTAAVAERLLRATSLSGRLFRNQTNFGFGGGHNQLFAASQSEYLLIVNQDIFLHPDCLKRLVELLDSQKNAAVVAPRLMKWEFARATNENIKQSLSEVVDSLGLKILRNRRVVEIGAGEKWPLLPYAKQNYHEVFGVSGALLLLRRSAAGAIKLLGSQVFDESYYMYKEDVDLAYRLRSAGYSAYTVLQALAYHDRTAAGFGSHRDVLAAKNKATQAEYVQFSSYKNHLATLFKNEYWQNAILDFPWIFWYEFKKLVYFVLCKPRVLRSLFQLWQQRAKLAADRKQIKSNRQLNWRQLRRWFV